MTKSIQQTGERGRATKPRPKRIQAELSWLSAINVDRSARENFETLTRGEQMVAIHRLADEGYSDYGIAAATKLSVEMVRQVLADRSTAG